MNAEQIQLIKDWYNDPTTTKKEKVLLEKLYPEVKESEDERIRSFLYEFIKVCGWSEKQYPPREKCLAYLEKQKEQKSAEWSEDDERMLKEIVSFFKDGTVKLQHDLDLYAGFLQDKLKFLRPAWKPSEEQMKALSFVKEYFKDVPSAKKEYIFLVSLYDDLKN